MSERLLENGVTEKKSGEAGIKYMNSSDVKKDVSHETHRDNGVTNSVEYGSEQGGLFDWFRRKRMKISEPTLVPDSEAGKDAEGHQFMSHRSKAIGEMVANATPEQLRSDPALQQLILSDFNSSFSQRLQQNDARTRESEMLNMRGKEGELWSFNQVLKAMLPENYGRDLMRDSGGDVYEGMNMIAGDFAEGGQLEQMGKYMGGARAAFSGSNFLDSDEEASQALMNNFMLRAVQPDLVNTGDKSHMQFGANLGKEVGALTANDELRKSGWFLQSIRRFFKKK